MMGLFRKPQGVLIVGSPTVSAFNVGLCAILNAGIQQHGSRSNVAVVAEYVPYRFDHTTMFLGPHADRRELRATMVRVVSQVFDTIVLAGHDQEAVASEAFKAAQRDRLVIAVLGGRDALSCVERCLAAGVDAWAMSQYLIGVVFFEMLLANCPHWRVRYAPDRHVLSGLGLAATKRWAFQRGAGCKACDGTGYHGFVCAPQIMEVDEALAAKLAASARPAELRKTATASGLRPLKNLALEKARQGLLPLEDVWLRFVKQRHCDH